MIFYQYKDLNKPNAVMILYDNIYIYFYINQAKTHCISINTGLRKNYKKKINKKNPDNYVPEDFPMHSIIKMVFTKV